MKKTIEKLAIFAGRGNLPKILIEYCLKNNIEFQLFLLKSEKYDIDYSEFNPISLYYGEVDKFLSELEKNNVKNIIFIGGVTKPNFKSLKVDKSAAKLLTKIIASKILGDDAVLRAVVRFFEKRGFAILQIDQILDDLVAKKSVLTEINPSNLDYENIEIAKKAILSFSKFDVGQSIIMAQKQIIAVEAVEGTDNMITRCKDLNVEYKKDAILVKMKKAKQSQKADLPTIGVKTIELCHQNQIKGIAIQAKKTLIVDKEEVIKKCNEYSIFLVAI